MIIDRLIDSPFFDTDRFNFHLKKHESRMVPYEENDPSNESFSMAASSLISLITTSNKLRIPSDYVNYIHQNIDDYENHILTIIHYGTNQPNLNYGLFYSYSKEKKIKILLSISSNKKKKVIQEYLKDKDIIKLVENYYKKSFL